MLSIFFSVVLGICSELQGFYDYVIQLEDKSTYSMSNLKGQKLLIYVIDPNNVDLETLEFLDDLQNKKSELRLLVFASKSATQQSDLFDSKIKEVRKKTSDKALVSKAQNASKSDVELQDPLFSWLTKHSRNGHFDVDATDGTLYIVNEEGALYAVLAPGTPQTVIASVAGQSYKSKRKG
jgi:hypothetical protein